MAIRRMTEKQKKFCDLYIKYGEATRAAKEAGYSSKTAYSIGVENLRKPELQSYIDARLQKLESARVADAEEVLRYLTSVVRGEYTEPIPILCGKGNQRLVNKEVGAKDRIKAAELLAKRYGLLTENVNLTGDVGVQIIDDIPKDNG